MHFLVVIIVLSCIYFYVMRYSFYQDIERCAMTSRVVIYGDSLMKGTVIDPSQRYRATINTHLHAFEEQFGLSIVNRARFGITSEQGLSLLEKDIASGLSCDYALIEFGGNDCNFQWTEISASPSAEHAPFTPPARFHEALLKMIHAVQGANATPVLMTLPPLDSERYLDFVSRACSKSNILHWLGDTHMIYRFHELYSSIIEQAAAQTGAILANVRSRFLENRNFSHLIGLDGVHLAPEGYSLLAQEFRALLSRRRDCSAN